MKKLIATICCLLLIAAGIQGLGHLVRPTDTDDEIKAIKTFHDLPENTVEVIAYGSSHAWKGLETMEMYREYGIGAYNYGGNWQHINTTSLFVHDSLRTQSPKVVLIETFRVGTLLEDTDIVGEVFYTKEIPDSEIKREYLDQCFDGKISRYLSYYVPLFAFHENWSDLTEESFVKNCADEEYSYTMGFDESDEVVPVQLENPETFEQKGISSEARNTLDDIVKICRQKGIEIIFYTVPYEGSYKYAEEMKAYAEENDCIYIDFFEKVEEIGLNCDTDFQDKGHLNTSGARKIANYLGRFISENYDITDMRMVEGNIWEKNCTR